MALTITKTGSHKEVKKRLLENLKRVGQMGGENAQEHVPVDKGWLRDSLEQGMHDEIFVNTWSVKIKYSKGTFDYAYLRHFKNLKNPHKTYWFEQDMARNGKIYLKEMGKL